MLGEGGRDPRAEEKEIMIHEVEKFCLERQRLVETSGKTEQKISTQAKDTVWMLAK